MALGPASKENEAFTAVDASFMPVNFVFSLTPTLFTGGEPALRKSMESFKILGDKRSIEKS